MRAAAIQANASPDEAVARRQYFGYDQPGPLPNAHFFDSRRQILCHDRRLPGGQSPDASDYDLQVSSRALVEQLQRHLRERYPTATPYEAVLARQRSNHGGNFKHEFIGKVFIDLADWAAKWTTRLNRKVNLAGFPQQGPTGASAPDPKDWILAPATF